MNKVICFFSQLYQGFLRGKHALHFIGTLVLKLYIREL